MRTKENRDKTDRWLHSEIMPGTYASTTETADYLLAQLGVHRRAVLKWGPMGLQQLSEARAGRFLLIGFAGKALTAIESAVDHLAPDAQEEARKVLRRQEEIRSLYRPIRDHRSRSRSA